MLLLGFVVGGLFVYSGGLAASENNSEGYFEVENWGNQSMDVTLIITDLRTDNRIFKKRFTLGADGYFTSDWPSMTAGKHQLTVIVDENRSDSYEFTVDEDDVGLGLSIGITKDEIRFSLESGGL